jgi:hypothetical protein
LVFSHPDHIIRYSSLVTTAGRLSKLPSNAATAVLLAINVTAGGNAKESATKQYTLPGLAVGLICGELTESAGTWQRCVVFPSTSSSGLAINDPPTNIDD